jgi:serine/threonine protein kinase
MPAPPLTIHNMGDAQKKTTIPRGTVVAYALGIASGLRHIHSKQVAHRDLKPHNILLTSGSNIKIADFGAAQDVRNERQMRRHATTTG